jgi:CDP-4-dehydro-6-deoxyglucose reductase
MTKQVRILPSGHCFKSEGNSNLLEAGLSAGLRLEYGCSNGNCGRCLARIVSGDVEKTRHFDFRVGEAKKLSGHVLMCCHKALTNVVLEAHEASSSNEIPSQQISAKVKSINVVNDNVALVHLRTPRSNRLRFLAGQHVQLGGNGVPGGLQSVGSCPCDDMHLHFQVPRLEGDDFSDYVFGQLKAGDRLDIEGPSGDFILDENSSRSLVFIAWRTGFAPVRSLIEQAMALELAESIHLIWVAENKQDRYLDNLCRSWADALDDFYYVPVDVDVGDGAGIMNAEIIECLKVEREQLVEHEFYIAGNELLVNACSEDLLAMGLDARLLHVDELLHA